MKDYVKEYESNWQVLKAVAAVFGILIVAAYLAHPVWAAIEVGLRALEPRGLQ